MKRYIFHKAIAPYRQQVLTIFFFFASITFGFAQDFSLAEAFEVLAQPEGESWRIAERDILREWSHSGSPAMDFLFSRGEEAMDQGHAPRAIAHLSVVIEQAPDFATAYQLRGAAYAAIGYHGPALADLSDALRLEPRHFLALTQLGALFEELGQQDAALVAYRASLDIHPHQNEAIDGVARLQKNHIATQI